jgi:moderate conductance mechanosensitive channel
VRYLTRLWHELISPGISAVRTGLEIFLIAVLAYIALRLISRAIKRFERRLDASPSPDAFEHAKRARTLSALIANTSRIFVIAAAVLMILDKVDINIAPILAGAGIVGLAVGFGAQTLVKDVISGFFLIFENQIRVGDAAEIDSISGIVESIHLRTVVIRDVQGAVHVIPCGSISKLANMTKDFAYAVVDAPVSHRNDPDTVLKAARAAGQELTVDTDWQDALMGHVEVLGIESIEDAGFRIRLRIRTVPHRQWEVARELRRRLKQSFDQAKIDMSTPPSSTRM